MNHRIIEKSKKTAFFILFFLYFFTFFVSLWTKSKRNETIIYICILPLLPAISPSHADTLCHF